MAALSRQIVPRMDGYDRAQQLATTLNFMRTTNIVKIFADYQLLAESTASAYVERLVGRIESAATGGAAQSAATTKLLRILKAYNFAKIAVQMTASALNAVVARSPSSVSGFYMTLNERPYDREGQPPYPLTVNNTATARIYVVPRAPGGTVDTPLGIIDKLTVLGMGPRIGAAVQRMPLGRELLQGPEAEYKILIRGLARYHTDTALSLMANTKMSTWAAAVQDTFQFAAFNYAPVEVNDARVVRLTPSPGIAITQNPDYRYSVRGVTLGQHGIKGELLMYDLYNGGGATIFNIAIEVGGGPPPPTGTKACFARGVEGTARSTSNAPISASLSGVANEGETIEPADQPG
ncbi:MAG: hypothetical protein EXR00_02020 [Alphaproteobacteria bacterium]|nr:hypothetical protein [Alphaproteobacteria bacterium]